jgi:[NiFe] hydrogenase assembly HybE family chaperone
VNPGAGSTSGAAQALVARYERIAATRMAGLPVVNPALRVQAVDFETLPGEPGVALGVLIAPWFMNLVRLPLDDAARGGMAAATQRRRRAVGDLRIDFTGHDEDGVGRFECCSLFSPMQDFADMAGAVEVAREVLLALREAVRSRPEQPARRGFLLGRRGAAAA